MDLRTLGRICQKYRERLGYFQHDVAEEISCSKENVSAFECGRNNNALILYWYIKNGLTIHEFNGGDIK